MIESPFSFEEDLTRDEFEKLGKLGLRWSHIEHILGNCLKTMLRISDDEAQIVVFPLSATQRIDQIKKLAPMSSINDEARAALDEILAVRKAIQYVRNSVVHAILARQADGDHGFHLRSKNRTLSKAQIFASEELTNYLAHAALSFRYALGLKGDPGQRHPLPARPEIPEFLRAFVSHR
jgi:hypothetical protein